MFSHEFLRRATLAINATRPSERVYLDADGNLLERRAATDFSPSPSGAAYSILGYSDMPLTLIQTRERLEHHGIAH